MEPVFDLAECDLDSDFDAPVEGPTEGDTAKTQPQTEAATPIPSGKTVKAYVVKYTAYRTLVGNF